MILDCHKLLEMLDEMRFDDGVVVEEDDVIVILEGVEDLVEEGIVGGGEAQI